MAVETSATKNIGLKSAGKILHNKLENLYPAKVWGASCAAGDAGDEVIAYLHDGETTGLADTALAAIALPTCTTSGLNITTNVGTYVVGDVTAVTAHATETKYVKISIQINDSNGVVEVLSREKTTGEYAAIAAGKTFGADLKEFSVPALGTVLTEIEDYI